MAESYSHPTPRVVTSYLESQPWLYQLKIERLANKLIIPGRPLAPTVAAIPVAAHQESPNILHAMNQYAQQRTDEPFSVLLYPNYPSRASKDEIDKTVDAIEHTKATFPQLDLRSTQADSLPKHHTIGSIRKTLWDTALLIAVQDRSFAKYGDVIGMNHDIDPVSISRNYVSRVQTKVFGDLQSPDPDSSPYGTYVRHALDDTYKNVSKVVFWHDLACRTAGPTGSYSAGFVTTLKQYARKNGFNKNHDIHETLQLIDDEWIRMIPGANMATSMRRFQDRLHSHSLGDVWTEDSFTSSDKCRTEPSSDITDERARQLIDDSLDSFLPRFFRNIVKGPNWEFPRSRKVLHQQITVKKKVATHALRDILDFPEIADNVEQLYPIADLEGDIFHYALLQRRH